MVSLGAGLYNVTAMVQDNQGNMAISANQPQVSISQTFSQPPFVQLNSPGFGETFTSGSQMYLYAQADDRDGTLEWVRFYANGQPISNAIPAYLGRGTTNYPYGFKWEVPAPGIYSIYAVAMDNSNNVVVSGFSTITATTGEDSLPSVEFDNPLKVADAYLQPSDIDAILGGAIQSITLTDGGQGYASAPTVEIVGDGSGATAVAIIGTDPNAIGYGQVIDINVTDGGTGYFDNNTTIRLIGGFPRIKPGGFAATAVLDLQLVAVQGTREFNYQPIVTILNGGAGYTEVPDVVIEGLGTGMTARAEILGGQVVDVLLPTPDKVT